MNCWFKNVRLEDKQEKESTKKEREKKWMNEWMNECMNEWFDEWKNELMNTSFLKGSANSFATSLLMSSMPDLNSLSTASVP